jgi:hypothetical protein
VDYGTHAQPSPKRYNFFPKGTIPQVQLKQFLRYLCQSDRGGVTLLKNILKRWSSLHYKCLHDLNHWPIGGLSVVQVKHSLSTSSDVTGCWEFCAYLWCIVWLSFVKAICSHYVCVKRVRTVSGIIWSHLLLVVRFSNIRGSTSPPLIPLTFIEIKLVVRQGNLDKCFDFWNMWTIETSQQPCWSPCRSPCHYKMAVSRTSCGTSSEGTVEVGSWGVWSNPETGMVLSLSQVDLQRCL